VFCASEYKRVTMKETVMTENEAPTLTDEEVVDRVLKGEKELYETIMRRYNQRLFRVSRSIVKDDDEAEDVMQEGYIRAYEHLGGFEKRSKFSTWITRIVINESLARIRKKSRVTYIDPQPAGDDYSVYHSTPSGMQDPEQRTINKELKVLLEKAVDGLPEKYRSVYMMREIEKISVIETGECLGLTESNVKVRLNRAKEMLRETLSAMYNDGELFPFNLVRCDRIVANVLQRVETYAG
jgi:RNA polymerase sigma factor (sigma-70 family)